MKKFFLILVSFSIAPDIYSQNVAAFLDYKKYFYVFDKGETKELEYKEVFSWQTGKDFVAYSNNEKSLKIYYDGKAEVVETAEPRSYHASENLCAWKMDRRLMVWDKGKITQLTEWANGYHVTDSLVIFVDHFGGDFNVYYKGEIKVLEEGAVTRSVNSYTFGKNIIAYTDLANEFKIFYRGNIYDVGTNDINRGFAGEDIVTFSNKYTNEFSVFYKGEVILLEDNLPKKISVADKMVAYVDYYGTFKLFYDFGTTELLSSEPDEWGAAGNFVTYTSGIELKVFWNGKNYTLENNLKFVANPVFPMMSGGGPNSIVWTDKNGKLKMFFKGEIKTNITYEIITGLYVERDILVFTSGVSTTSVYWEGKVY